MKKELIDMIEYVKSNGKIDDRLLGMEGIGVGNSISLTWDGFTLGIDKLGAWMFSNKSLHTVKNQVFNLMVEKGELDYVSNAGKSITIPRYFNPKKYDMTQYVELIVEGLILVDTVKTDTDAFYKTLKTIASTGKVPNNTKVWKISNMDKLVDKLDDFIKSLIDYPLPKLPLKDVYKNFGAVTLLTNKFNEVAVNIKQRDIEILYKELNRIKTVGDIIITKSEHGDYDFTIGEKDSIKYMFNEFTRGVNIAGVMLGLINELSAVFNTQINELIKLKK